MSLVLIKTNLIKINLTRWRVKLIIKTCLLGKSTHSVLSQDTCFYLFIIKFFLQENGKVFY